MPAKAGPWWRASRRMWYATRGGTQYPLGVRDPDARAAADVPFRALLDRLSGVAPARTGEKLFAWAVTGLTAAGDPTIATGFGTATDEDAARAESVRHLPKLQEMLGPKAPRLKLDPSVWEAPLAVLEYVLRSNGYTVTAPNLG